VLTLIVSLLGVINSLSQGWLMLRPWPSWKNAVRRMVLTVVSLYLYVYELICAIQLLASPAHSPLIFTPSLLIMGIYSLALVRAWELLGVQRTGLLAWLNPLNEVNTSTSVHENLLRFGEISDPAKITAYSRRAGSANLLLSPSHLHLFKA
jgi:hypothetical protein